MMWMAVFVVVCVFIFLNFFLTSFAFLSYLYLVLNLAKKAAVYRLIVKTV